MLKTVRCLFLSSPLFLSSFFPLAIISEQMNISKEIRKAKSCSSKQIHLIIKHSNVPYFFVSSYLRKSFPLTISQSTRKIKEKCFLLLKCDNYIKKLSVFSVFNLYSIKKKKKTFYFLTKNARFSHVTRFCLILYLLRNIVSKFPKKA